MAAGPTPKERIVQNLRESLDRVHREIEKLDIWAGALSAFVKPIPEYEISDRFALPKRHGTEVPATWTKNTG